MRSISRPLRAALAATALAAAAFAQAATQPATPASGDSPVTVSFGDTSKFTDAANTRFGIDANMKTLATALQQLGQRYLPEGQALKIEVLDVDLAGDMWPSQRALQEIRIARGGADWPRIQLRYTLTAGGQTLQSGEETVSDMSYLQNMRATYMNSDPLRYEKAMLEDWFEGKFGARKSAAASTTR